MDEYPVDPNAPTLPMDPYMVGPDDPTLLMDGAATQPSTWQDHRLADTWDNFLDRVTDSRIGMICLVIVIWALLLGVPAVLIWHLALWMGIHPDHGLGQTAVTALYLSYAVDIFFLPDLVHIVVYAMEEWPTVPQWLFYIWPFLLVVGEVAVCVTLWVVAR